MKRKSCTIKTASHNIFLLNIHYLFSPKMYKFIISVIFSLALTSSIHAQSKEEKLAKKAADAEQKGDYKAAVGYLTDLIEMSPNNYSYYLVRGNSYISLGEIDRALADLDKSIKLKPTCDAYYSRSYLYSMLSKPDKAIADGNKALELCGAQSEYAKTIYINRGAAKAKKRDFQGAYDDYMKAYAFDSTYFETLLSIGTVLDEIDQDSLALAYLMKAYKVDSTNAKVLNNIGFFYQSHEQYDLSLVYMQKARDQDKTDPFAWNNLGFCKYKMGDHKGAMDDINQSLKLDPTNSYAWRNRGMVYLAMGNKTAACSDLEKALSLGYSTRYGYDVQELYNGNCK